MNTLIPVITVVALSIASVYDIRTGEVPVKIWLIASCFILPLSFVRGTIKESLIGGVISFAVCFAMAFFSNLGGADALCGMLLGFSLGLFGLWGILWSFVLCIPYTIFMKIKNNEHDYPFIPFMECGFLITLLTM